MRDDLIIQLIIIRWFLIQLFENRSAIEAWLSTGENQKFREIVKNIVELPMLADFVAALKLLPDQQEAMSAFFTRNPHVETQLLKLLQINEKKEAKHNTTTFKLTVDLTDVAAAWYKTNPLVLTITELSAYTTTLTAMASRKTCFYNVNILGIASKALAKFILDDANVFAQVAEDTVPFGAEPILALGLQAGYCETQYAEHKFFIERLLQFAGDPSIPRPAGLSERSAPHHATRAILQRTGYYKAIQVAFSSEVIRINVILCGDSLTTPLIMKLIDQVIKPENHPNYNHALDKSKEAQYLLQWNKLPWVGDDKMLQLSIVANYCRASLFKSAAINEFLKNVPFSTRVLFLRHTQNIVDLKSFIESQEQPLAAQLLYVLTQNSIYATDASKHLLSIQGSSPGMFSSLFSPSIKENLAVKFFQAFLKKDIEALAQCIRREFEQCQHYMEFGLGQNSPQQLSENVNFLKELCNNRTVLEIDIHDKILAIINQRLESVGLEKLPTPARAATPVSAIPASEQKALDEKHDTLFTL